MEAVLRARRRASHALDAAREALVAARNARRSRGGRCARASRSSHSPPSSILPAPRWAASCPAFWARIVAATAAASSPPRTVSSARECAPIVAPAAAADLAARLADRERAFAEPIDVSAKRSSPADPMARRAKTAALAVPRERLEHARLEGARLRVARLSSSPPATSRAGTRSRTPPDGPPRRATRPRARLVDEAREALEGTRTAPSDLTQPPPRRPSGGAAEPPPPPTRRRRDERAPLFSDRSRSAATASQSRSTSTASSLATTTSATKSRTSRGQSRRPARRRRAVPEGLVVRVSAAPRPLSRASGGGGAASRWAPASSAPPPSPAPSCGAPVRARGRGRRVSARARGGGFRGPGGGETFGLAALRRGRVFFPALALRAAIL